MMVAEALWSPLACVGKIRVQGERLDPSPTHPSRDHKAQEETMPGTPAYMVIGTTENVTTGEALAAQEDYYRAGLYLSPNAAETALSKVKVPSKYMFLSIVKVTVRFYVCVDEDADDEDMATSSRTNSKYVPPILSGPFDTVDQAEMVCLLVDRSRWKGAIVLAMTDDGAARADHVE